MLFKSYKYFFYVLTINVFFLTINAMPPQQQKIGPYQFKRTTSHPKKVPNRHFMPPIKQRHAATQNIVMETYEAFTKNLEENYIPTSIKCGGLRYTYVNKETILKSEKPNLVKTNYKFKLPFIDICVTVILDFEAYFKEKKVKELNLIPIIIIESPQNTLISKLNVQQLNNFDSIPKAIKDLFDTIHPFICKTIRNLES